MAELGRKHNVHIFRLPPHTTHKTQPLDVGCFGLLARKWLERCEQIVEETRENILREDFIREYLMVRDQCMSRNVILAAWKKTGLSPLNPGIFDDDDFAPSNVTSTRSYMPDDFPLPRQGEPKSAEDVEDAEDDEDEGSADGSDSESESTETESEPDSESSDEEQDSQEADQDSDLTSSELPVVTMVALSFPAPSDPIAAPYPDSSTSSTSDAPAVPHPPELSDDILEYPLPTPVAPEAPPSESSHSSTPSSHSSPSLSAEPDSDSEMNSDSDSEAVFDFDEITKGLQHKSSKADILGLLRDTCRRGAKKVKKAKEEVELYRTHCHFASEENKTLKQQLNKAEKKKGRRTLKTQKAHLTSDEAWLMYDEQEAEDAAEAAKAAEKQKAKEDRKEENVRRRAHLIQLGSSLRFTKPLSQCKRDDLEDIAIILGMAIDSKSDTVKTLYSRIQAHFTANPHLKEDARFMGLFPRATGRRRTTRTEPENAAATSSNTIVSSRDHDGPSHIWPTLYTMDSPPSPPRPSTPEGSRPTVIIPLSPSNGSRIYRDTRHLERRYHPYSRSSPRLRPALFPS